MIVALHEENSRLYLWVPHVDVMVEASAKDHIHICVPIQRMDAQLMAVGKLMLKREIVHFPKSNDFVHAARS